MYKTGGNHTEADVLCALQSLMMELKLEYDYNGIAFEQIGGGTKGDQTKWVNMYRAIIVMFGDMRGLPVVGIAPATIKKAVTGSGRADKQEMIAAIKELGYSPKDDNVADAIGCGIAFWQNLEKGIYNADRNNGQERVRKKPRKRTP